MCGVAGMAPVAAYKLTSEVAHRYFSDRITLCLQISSVVISLMAVTWLTDLSFIAATSLFLIGNMGSIALMVAGVAVAVFGVALVLLATLLHPTSFDEIKNDKQTT